jgi:hypothetical protein
MSGWLRPWRRITKKTLRSTIDEVLELPGRLRDTADNDARLAEAAEAHGHHRRAAELRGQAVGLEGAADQIVVTVAGGLGVWPDYDAAQAEARAAGLIHPRRRIVSAATHAVYDAAYDVCARARDVAAENLPVFGSGVPEALVWLCAACGYHRDSIVAAARAVDAAFTPTPAGGFCAPEALLEGSLLILRSSVRRLDEAQGDGS